VYQTYPGIMRKQSQNLRIEICDYCRYIRSLWWAHICGTHISSECRWSKLCFSSSYRQSLLCRYYV